MTIVRLCLHWKALSWSEEKWLIKEKKIMIPIHNKRLGACWFAAALFLLVLCCWKYTVDVLQWMMEDDVSWHLTAPVILNITVWLESTFSRLLRVFQGLLATKELFAWSDHLNQSPDIIPLAFSYAVFNSCFWLLAIHCQFSINEQCQPSIHYPSPLEACQPWQRGKRLNMQIMEKILDTYLKTKGPF